MLMLLAVAPTYAADDSEMLEVKTDSVKTYDKGDVLIYSGISVMSTGLITTVFASRYVGLGTMGIGGIITSIGVGIKIRNKIRAESK